MKGFVRFFILFAVVTSVFHSGVSAQNVVTRGDSLLYWGQALLKNINQQNTTYQHKNNVVSWGNNGAPVQCYADCSGFINALIQKTEHWTDLDLKHNLGYKRPFAYHYVNAINSGQHFKKIVNVADILPGDLIAIAYADRSEHEDNTGHIMLIASLPKLHTSSKVFEPNSYQYQVEVIDCSKSAHGKLDTRYGATYSGLGKGTFRLYTDLRGNITGYSWSIENPKPDFDPYANQVVVGRLIDGL